VASSGPGSATRRRQGAWNVSALVYRWSTTAVADQADGDLLRYLGDRLTGSVVVDCGCGPGLLAATLVSRGAASVMAVDANPAMARQARRRLARELSTGQVCVVCDFVDAPFFDALGRAVDIVVFKRSLYAPEGEAAATLRAAVRAVVDSGVVVVVHPERSLRRYAWGVPPAWRPHTMFHVFNRLVSWLAVALRISAYRAYTAHELEALLRSAADDETVERVPTAQEAYNIAAIRVSAA
jgi:SAM-dependent methyltransferase